MRHDPYTSASCINDMTHAHLHGADVYERCVCVMSYVSDTDAHINIHICLMHECRDACTPHWRACVARATVEGEVHSVTHVQRLTHT